MARPEVTGRKASKLAGAVNDLDAYSIDKFCRRHGFSPQLFYKFKHEMPATFNVGTRVLITRETAAEWRAARTKSDS
ncbi:hypothetical protein [Bradyrhizobium sp. JYMT SZCCT0428]|uniref:hypothetical protein n=1 Tax=Bradyrhizobium sp. JYMT SZCCT0428 TaxID=2807673 RepID=UPI001BA9919C|nr:hypothetical protein [Bradyrhizobium sp. JYMT SZCCT0428]MBR1151712.1 hypothetical protein [Bradyrhizobium sp. JYMT SZCCT0428]